MLCCLSDRPWRPSGQEYRDQAPGATARPSPGQRIHDQDPKAQGEPFVYLFVTSFLVNFSFCMTDIPMFVVSAGSERGCEYQQVLRRSYVVGAGQTGRGA